MRFPFTWKTCVPSPSQQLLWQCKKGETYRVTTGDAKVKFVDYYNYRETEVFTIGNKSIIKDFIEFTREKIKIRIADIEQQLVG